MDSYLRFAAFFFVSLLAPWAQAAPVPVDHATVELIGEKTALVPGEESAVALRFELEPHWHIYWKNPGASGLPVEIEWELPAGVEAGAIEWPSPERIDLEGLVNYVYEDVVTFIVPLRVSDSLELGQDVEIGASAFWLICKELCLPGDAALSLSLPVEATAALSDEAPAFAQAREHQPLKESPWAAAAYLDGQELVLQLEGDALPEDLYFYAETEGWIDPSAAQALSFPAADRAELRLVLDAPFFEQNLESMAGVLQSGEHSWQLSFGLSAAPLSLPQPEVVVAEPAGFEQHLLELGLPGFLLLAFLGGLILNVMPCVLPVLSLKVFSLLKHAGQSKKQALAHGLAYTAGVVVSFLALAGALFALRSLGERIGWGFQLQSPGFLVVLTAVFFLFALNLLGVFELGSRLVGADAKVAQRNDVAGSFGMGVLAAVVGAPCMGPLVAGVSGLAVQASVGTGLLIFGTMGLGLASPFLLLSLFPKLVGFLPKPGAWMESFKQSMGFLLMAAVVFLIYVAGRQGGIDAMLALLIVVLICAVAGWVFGRWGAPVRSKTAQWLAKLVAIGGITGGLFYGIDATKFAYANYNDAAVAGDASGQWQAWSTERVEAELAAGKPVFVDFTATWCLICQVNKKVALRTDATEALFEEYGIVALSADWTRYDPVITDALESFGRSGVPLYVLYTPEGEVEVLPQSLTNGTVREAVERALGD